LDEVDSDFRATGNPPQQKRDVSGLQQTMHDSVRTPYRHIPICFARAYPLQDELPNLAKPYLDYPTDMVLEVISKDRPCPDGYTKWQQGFTPKEHREMLDSQKMLQWQAEREDADRAWRERQDRLADERAENRHWREIAIVGVLVGGAAIVAQIVAAFIERGSWF